MRKKISKYLLRVTIIIAVVTLLAYLTTQISPAVFWPVALVGYAVPFLVIINICLAILWIKSRNHKIYMIIPILVTLLGFQAIRSTFSPNFIQLTPEQFSVMSYNARVFNLYANRSKQDSLSRNLINWVADRTYDVKCIQEYYGKTGSKFYDTKAAMEERGHYSYVKSGLVDGSGAIFGLAIFSKHPIIHTGNVYLESDHVANEAIYADVVVHKKDTIRIINTHLESLSLKEEELTKRSEMKSLIGKLKDGWQTRAGQVDQLVEFVNSSPYPIVLSGDLNDLPYSYIYQELNSVMHNAFEKAGFGFGFSYNGVIPILRIDNQFYTSQLRAVNFRTLYQANQTDHFPIVGYYTIRSTVQD